MLVTTCEYLHSNGLKTLAATIALATISHIAVAAETPVLYHAILSKPASATTTASSSSTPPNYGPYAKACTKNPGTGDASEASGEASFVYYPKSKKLEYTLNYKGLSGAAMMAHFHYQPSSGPIVQTICGKPSVKTLDGVGVSEKRPLNGQFCNAKDHTANHGVIKGSYYLMGNQKISPAPSPAITTGAEEATQLEAGQLFVNFHTCLNMGGEIMGTLVPGALPKK